MYKFKLFRVNSSTLLIICLTRRVILHLNLKCIIPLWMCIGYWNLIVHFLFGLLEAFNLNVKNCTIGVSLVKGPFIPWSEGTKPNVWRALFGALCINVPCLHLKKRIVVNCLCLSHHPGGLIQGFPTWLCMRKHGGIFKILIPYFAPECLTVWRLGK